MKPFLSILALGLAALSAPTFAAEGEKPGCEAPARLAEPWTSWTQTGTAIAGGDSLNAPRLILGKPVTATLRPTRYVQYAATPGKGADQGQGGLFTLSLKSPARIGIALSDAAWVDVVDDRTAIASVEHGHGPDCSGIRKIVWFDLKEGAHLVQIAGAPGREIRIMAADERANRPMPRPDDGF
ncbi:hypothetical protein [Sphingobium cloacae]|uniref:Uncharacterized protein n=1 Tax=Sphingobium cloacae TaxID=120107 RepID=A0A1E1EYI5_9SPHN|nr:hypothetical protein [Sphingobium cloacae]BAV63272.1 hypothetical protein SCLO_1002320 [Sphingobium cloacae]